jgi:hypothetical protein
MEGLPSERVFDRRSRLLLVPLSSKQNLAGGCVSSLFHMRSNKASHELSFHPRSFPGHVSLLSRLNMIIYPFNSSLFQEFSRHFVSGRSNSAVHLSKW